ncbi:hypothetical protein SLS58_004637 [Diplodia intermedia]|uniref:ABC transporter n=1 Tax=Diplodia intermedia TaxID=856260 RepID=A0ABR3TTS7_9PEZI
MDLDSCISRFPQPWLSLALATAVSLLGVISIRLAVRHKRQEPRRLSQNSTACGTSSTALQDMYFKLHNLEHNPDILPEAKALLLSLLSRTLEEAQKRHQEPSSILALDTYAAPQLESFLQRRRAATSQQWAAYLARRARGGPRELVATADAARQWLARQAPLRLVDGAWLGHVQRATTPFALRPFTTASWLVLSEELGDGAPEQNHVRVYRQLLEQVGIALPAPHSADFVESCSAVPVEVWRAAVGQLLVSLFAHAFLPEALGFSLHFEEATLETLRAARELRELRLDARYFLLHLCIDNAASGHAAMAQHVVAGYLDHVRADSGPAAAQAAWRRVQAGFVLSEHLADRHLPANDDDEPIPRSPVEEELLRIVRAKARALQHGTHGASQARVGPRRLAEWLDDDPARWLDDGGAAAVDRQRGFLDALAGSAAWVRRGDPGASPLLRELRWGGKMFGAFTRRETDVVRAWIESLAPAACYYRFTGREAISDGAGEDVTADYPVFADQWRLHPELDVGLPLPAASSSHDMRDCAPFRLAPGARPRVAVLMPLWFAHTALLEAFLAVPARTTTALAAAVLRCVRAQLGFGDGGGGGVAGMDELRATPSRMGIVELGLEMCSKLDGGAARPPRSLKEVLDMWPHEAAVQMLHLALRPISYGALLIGMARAFVDMHEAVAGLGLLARESQERLESIAEREKTNLSEAVEYLCTDRSQAEQASRGYFWARSRVEECFASPAQ